MNPATYAYLLAIVVLEQDTLTGPQGTAHGHLASRMYASLTEEERPEAFAARRLLKTIDRFAARATAT